MSDERKSIIIDPLLDQEENLQEEQTFEAQEEELSATEQTHEQESSIPEKYRGKSIEDIIEMHQNAEKALGAKNNELGQWRSLTQQLVDQTGATDAGASEGDSFELSSDDLFDNPQEAINKVVEKALQDRLAPIEQDRQHAAQEAAMRNLYERHPDIEEVTASTQFQEWAMSNDFRARDLQAAAQGDIYAGERLLSDYKEIKAAGSSAQPESPEKKEGIEAAKAVATERGGTSGAIANAKTYDATDIARMIRRDPQKYNSPEFQAELKLAIKEGRVRGL